MSRVTCTKCGKSSRLSEAGDWNAVVRAGIVVAALCPRCQTPDQNAEAVINEATLTYGTDAFGRAIGRTK